ncbi:type VI secretion system Vgr family protein [Aestuariibius insulae]|uniref:type VI secretion system Vgr family protein n=1 Tax=Aestuariibius insulae TaxID=2058287 RepID=UPI00398E5596
MCLQARHSFRSLAYGSGDANGDERAYDGAYVLIPDDAPLMPERRTPAPRIAGPETAVVVGEGEIDCDEHGRILVRFHWDLGGAHSMRVRVSQNWASKGWGGMVIPRIGMEVIVEHLRGDSDKPIVTGCVYNGKNQPPYELPKHKTRSTFKSDTHQGTGFNELRFEDKNEQEEIRLHAQNDLNTIVRRDSSEIVLRNKSGLIEGNCLQEVSGGLLTNAGVGIVFSAGITGLDETASAGMGAQVNKVSASARTLRRGKFTQMRNGSMSFQADGDIRSEARGSVTQTALGSTTLSSGESYRLSVGSGLTFDVRRNVMISSQRTVHINAADRIMFKVGSSSLTLDRDGTVTLRGSDVRIEGSSTIRSKAPRIDLN